MNTRNVRYTLLATAAVVWCVLSVRAQTTAGLAGTVHDSSGAVVSAVTITARHTQTNFTRTTASGDDGRFVFPEMRVGAYDIHAERSGFRPVDKRGVMATLGETTAVNLVLEVGAIEAVEDVSATGPLVNIHSAELSYLVNERAIRDLPLITTIVPDDNARQGVLADPARPGQTITVQVNEAVRPYLNEFPRANGSAIGQGLAVYRFGFTNKSTKISCKRESTRILLQTIKSLFVIRSMMLISDFQPTSPSFPVPLSRGINS